MLKLKNDGATTLATDINSSVTRIEVTDGTVFPELVDAGDWFPLTLIKGSNVERMRVTARAGNTLTVIRKEEGTNAQPWVVGDNCTLSVTAGALAAIKKPVNTIDEANTSDSVSGAAVYSHSILKGNYQGIIDGDYFPLKNMYFRTTSASFSMLEGLQCSYYIPLTKDDTLVVTGFDKGANYDHFVFFDVDKVFISALSVLSTDTTVTLSGFVIPENTSFIVINSSDAKENLQSVTKNGIVLLETTVLKTENDLELLETFLPAGQGVVDGAYKANGKGHYIDSTAGKLFPYDSVFLTYYIPYTSEDSLIAENTVKGGSFGNVTFFDSDKVFISALTFDSSPNIVDLDSGNTPVNTAYIVLAYSAGNTIKATINGVSTVLDRLTTLESELGNTITPAIAVNDIAVNQLKNFSPAGQGIVDGAYKSAARGYISNTTGKFLEHGSFSLTYYIPFVSGETAVATNTAKSTSFSNVTFFDSDKVFISALSVGSVPNIVDLDSGNTPSNTAYIVFAYLNDADIQIIINGNLSLSSRLVDLESGGSLDDVEEKITNLFDGDYFTLKGFYRNNTTGALTAHGLFNTTELIPFTENDSMYAFGTSKSGSLSNINFYDENRAFIGVYNLGGAEPKLIIDQFYTAITPAGTQYIALNNYPTHYPKTEVSINSLSSVYDMSTQLTRHYARGKRFTFFGDSITALTAWELKVAGIINCLPTIRGVGSSAMASDGPTRVGVEPDGMYIDRRANYASDLDYTDALAARGFTNLVTTPTWIEYSNNPTGYTLPANSYFDILSQANSQERINTLPTDTQVVSIMFGTNDDKTTLGSLDDYGELSGEARTVSFIGSYRLCLDMIKAHCPDALVVLCIPTRKASEYSGNSRTTDGINFNLMRGLIKDMCNAYGYEYIDFSTVINHSNSADLLADGIHPNTNGQDLMSKKYALSIGKLAIKDTK